MAAMMTVLFLISLGDRMGSTAFCSTLTKRTRRTAATRIITMDSTLTHSKSLPPNSKSRMKSIRRMESSAIPFPSMTGFSSLMGVGNFLMVRKNATAAMGRLM